MAEIKFYANIDGIASTGNPTLINHAAGSGIGFYGASYGISVPVGEYQDTTYVTNANGTATDEYALQNTKYVSVSGLDGVGGANANRKTPNYWAPLNIRFTHNEAVRVQNCKLRIFDRLDIENQASGVTTQIYEIRHPNASTSASGLAHRGIANHSWQTFDPEDNMFDMAFTSSPGASGLNTIAGETVPSGEGGFVSWVTAEGAAHESTRHDWYVALSASPDSIGSKTNYGLYFTCEYL
jgi:hypothetical protein